MSVHHKKKSNLSLLSIQKKTLANQKIIRRLESILIVSLISRRFY